MAKNVLFIQAHEADKAVFFSSIANFLQGKGIHTKHLTFRRLEKYVYEKNGVFDTVFMPRVLKEYNHILSVEDEKKYDLSKLLFYTLKLNSLNNYSFDTDNIYSNARRYLNFLKELHFSQKIDLIIMWNDTFMYDSLSKAFASNFNIPTLIFEAGIFRPNTITMDSKGVNYGNSVPEDQSYYSNVKYEKNFINSLTDIKFEDKLYSFELPKLKKFYLLERSKDKLFSKVLKQELDLEIIYENTLQKVKKRIEKRKKVNGYSLFKDLPSRYLFIPFQVHDDSQVLLNSPYINSMEELVEIIDYNLEQYNAQYNDDLFVVFKEHPADKGRTNYSSLYDKYKDNKRLIFMTEGETSKLLKNSQGVITINSTVGIEALQQYKHVITLGNAYYNINGLVQICSDPSKLYEHINHIVNNDVDIHLINQFIYYLRFNYQLEGNWRKGSFDVFYLESTLTKLLNS